MQNYTDNTNGDVSLIVENVWYFSFPLRSRCADVLLERKAELIKRFLYKKVFLLSFLLSQLTRDHMRKCDK